MARQIPSLTELKDTNGLHRVVRDIYAQLDKIETVNPAPAMPKEDDKLVIRRNKDGSLNVDDIEAIRTQLGLDPTVTGQPKNAFEQTRDPNTMIDTAALGFGPGSHWVNMATTPLPSVWYCVRANEFESAWRRIDRP